MALEFLGFPVATLALVVAGASFLIAALALGWQVAKHFLDGGRVKVFLNSAIWHPGYRILTRRSGHWELVKETEGMMREYFEVAQVVVENPSRIPVTIHTPSLDVRGIERSKRSLTPRMFALEDFGAESATTAPVVRVEPYDRVTFVMDYWSVVPGLLKKAGSGGLELRAMVSVAGRARPQRSKRKLRWRIPQGAWTAQRDLDVIAPYTVLWRELFRSVPAEQDADIQSRQVTQGLVSFLLGEAVHQFDECPSREDLKGALDDAAKKHLDIEYPVTGMGLYNGYEALKTLEGHLGPWRWRTPDSSDSEVADTTLEQ